MFCAPDNRIAHSTLYKAVHGLGRLFYSDAEFRKLCEERLPALKTIPGWSIPPWPPPKSRYIYTVIREQGVRHLIRFLWHQYLNLSEVFDRFVIALERLFVHSNQQIPVLYKNDCQQGESTSNTA